MAKVFNSWRGPSVTNSSYMMGKALIAKTIPKKPTLMGLFRILWPRSVLIPEMNFVCTSKCSLMASMFLGFMGVLKPFANEFLLFIASKMLSKQRMNSTVASDPENSGCFSSLFKNSIASAILADRVCAARET